MDEEEVQYLRKKVKQLEEMMIKMNDKIGRILDEFLNHKANQAAGLQLIFQDDADMCLSLMSQFKSSGSPNNSSTMSRKRPTRNSHYPQAGDKNKDLVQQSQLRGTKRKIERPSTRYHSQTQLGDKAHQPESQPQAEDDDFHEDDSNFDGSSDIQLETIPKVIMSNTTNETKNRRSSSSGGRRQNKTEPSNEPDECDPLELGDEVEVEADDHSDEDYIERKFTKHRRSDSGGADVLHKKNYKFIKTFSNKSEALAYVKSAKQWTRNKNRKSKEGLIMYYRCKFWGRNGKCPATMHLRQVSNSDQFEYFIANDVEHQHNNDKG